jgi:hypothetical protein
MRVLVFAFVGAMFLLWGAYALRPRQRKWSNALLVAGCVLLLVALGALFRWY